MLYSSFFTVAEFACHDGTQYPIAWIDNQLQALCSQLDIVRGAYGGPNRVVSGYRTEEYNQRIGGKPHSQHLKGLAADIAPFAHPAQMEDATADLYALIQRLMSQQRLPLIGGIGVYPHWIHLDIRPKPADGHIARWVGQGVGSEQ